MSKFTAILGVIATILIAVVGISTYSDGSGYMTWFGIELSQTGFYILIAAFAVFDFFAVKSAFGAQKKEEQRQTAVKEQVSEQNANAEKLDSPCNVTLTRLKSVVGCAMGVQVYLNGDYQDVVKNGQSVTMRTELKYNVLSVHYNADSAARSIEFEARPGDDVQIELKYTGAVLTVVSR